MYLSLFLGPFSRGPEEDLVLIDLCIEHAIRGAEAGFAMVTFGEQHFNSYEPYCDPFLMGARLAGSLGDTYFGTTVVPLPLHNPLRLAEKVSILDLLMRGRTVFGLSAGRPAPFNDLPNFGVDTADRDKAFAMKLDTLLQLLAHQQGDAPVIVDTPWEKGALRGRLMPLSYRARRPMFAIGTSTPGSVLATGARGWPVFLGPAHPRLLTSLLGAYDEGLTQAGVSQADADLCRMMSLTTRIVVVGDTDEEAWARAERMLAGAQFTQGAAVPLRDLAKVDLANETNLSTAPMLRTPAAVQSWLVVGSPDSVVEQIQALERCGLRHLNVRFAAGPYNPQDMNRSFRLFLDQCAPKLDLQRFPAPEGDRVRHEHREPALAREVQELFIRG